jgi:uncharacterized membrane protein YphA (DoxX/SURF4 family)
MELWTAIRWAGKLCFGGFFLLGGLQHFTQYKSMVAYGQTKGLPLAPLMIPITGSMLVAGSLLVLFGWHELWGLGLIALFLVPVALTMHNFWVETDPQQRANQQANFGKNVALAGACLLLAALIHRGGAM